MVIIIALLSVALFTLIGVLNFSDGSLKWLAVDIYNIIILSFIACIFAIEKPIKIETKALEILLFACVVSIFMAYALNSSKFWLFSDILVISIALLSALKQLIHK